ncbi:MAG: glutamate racemase [Candidatus Saccharimonadales bacterium]
MATIIGVFDSGIGGLSIANAVRKAFPEADVRFVNDKEHVPYGTKTNKEIFNLAYPILKKLQDGGCNIIVVACNTVSTTIIKELRQKLSIPLVAIEPMVKPAAALTKSKVIAVCATPATLASHRYNELKKDYAQGITVVEPDCANWAELIERNSLGRKQISDTVEEVIKKGADVIVLGCTHYHWIEEDIKREVDERAMVIQPETAIVRRVQQVLKQLV